MKPNIGTVDRALRIIVGLGIIAYGIVNHTWLGAIGAVPLLTAFCALLPAVCPARHQHLRQSGNDKGGGCCGGGKCC